VTKAILHEHQAGGEASNKSMPESDLEQFINKVLLVFALFNA